MCLKQSVDVSQLKADPSTGRLVTAGVSRKISDFDKNALEEAVRIKEKNGWELVTVTVNFEEVKASIREALAIGADKGFVVLDEALKDSDTWATMTAKATIDGFRVFEQSPIADSPFARNQGRAIFIFVDFYFLDLDLFVSSPKNTRWGN